MLSPASKRNISRIIPFGLLWLLFSLAYTLVEKGLLAQLNYYPSTGNPYNFSKNIFLTPAIASVTGLLIGTLEILYFNKLFIHKSFTKKIIYKSAAYLVIVVIFLVALSAITNIIELHKPVFSKEVWANVRLFLLDYSFLSVLLYIASTILVSQFYNEVSETTSQQKKKGFLCSWI